MTYFGGYFFKVVCVCAICGSSGTTTTHYYVRRKVLLVVRSYRLCKKKKNRFNDSTTLKESSLKFKWERQHPNHAAHVVQKQTCTPENVKSVKWRIARNARNYI